MKIVLLILLTGAALVDVVPTSVAEAAEKDERGPRILLVRPVITRSDDNADPAIAKTYEKQIQFVYQQAGVTIVWLPSVYLESTAARDGSIRPDQVVKLDHFS